MALSSLSEDFQAALADPGVLVVNGGTTEIEPHAMVADEDSTMPLPDILEFPKKLKTVLVLVDPKTGLNSAKRYVKQAAQVAKGQSSMPVPIVCMLEAELMGKDPNRVAMVQKLLIDAGATQVVLGQWACFVNAPTVLGMRAGNSKVEVLADAYDGFAQMSMGRYTLHIS
mmetsp:Transcript_17626/g.37404  ORF Transcript_17626/g.37404 Transcript_17626/m.37404 type:complete len:170 (-) Transcript_17626:40-549(-)